MKMKAKLYNFIPKNTFIYEYMKYCENLETPTNFDFWGAVWIVSLFLERHLAILRPNAPLFPNFYITFVANSGECRKSTAINCANNIIQMMINDKDKINIMTGTTSTARFNYILTKASAVDNKCIIGINCSEFITFFKNKNIIECFTDLYDCPLERKGYGTFTNGEINIRNVFVSSISATTPNYYFKAITKEEIEGGFTSRNIILPAETGKRRIAWNEHKADEALLLYQGRKIQEFIKYTKAAGFTLSPTAIQRYSRWYLRRRKSADLYTRTFEAREQDFVLKLAAILAANDRTAEISEIHIENAIKIIQSVKKDAQKFFNDALYEENVSTLDKTITRIRDIIHSKGANGIQHRELYLRVHNSCTSDEYNYIINMMHELGMIEKLQPYKSKAVIYRETKNLYKIDITKVIEKL
ncbi:MAG: hypothetical protein IKT40_01030 [Bacilli bacterium]|nr:hypothetical protein [Bacilli bacterium]